MKAIIFTCLIVIFLVPASTAQNYSCVAPEYKTWFTNAKGYLRGMRIDSVVAMNGNTVYYPYKTARVRGRHLVSSPYQFVEDSAAGSWMGSEIIETTDGYTFIKNQHDDTITINRLAAVGDSWVFFRNSSARYYQAEVIASDTMNVSGNVDSFKRIRLSAMEGNLMIPEDSLHGLELVLTKNYGFATVFDLYLFPYPGYFSALTEKDYFFNLASDNGPEPQNIRASLSFSRVPFTPPTQLNVYNFETGDIHNTYYSNYNVQSGWTAIETTRTTILSKTLSNGVLSYNCSYTTHVHYYGSQNSPPDQTLSGTSTVMIQDSVLWDTLRMPEEWQHEMIYYYFPYDTSYCITSARYTAHNSMIVEGGRLDHFEPSSHVFAFKDGTGLVSSAEYVFPNLFYDRALSSTGKQPPYCDRENNPVDIHDVAAPDNVRFKIFPNPANEHIYIEFEDDALSEVSLTDITGRNAAIDVIKGKAKISFSTAHIPAGIYLLTLRGSNSNAVRKIVVHH